ncbi:MAG: methyltransferase domain-containing protein [Balneolaceae bacterium]
MSWFKEWFSSPLYEKLYASRNIDEAELLVNLIETEIPKLTYQDILDLGCGRGRHSISLAEKGYKVTGIDLSEEAIRTARKNAVERGFPEIDFRVRDMRNPLPRKFDAVVNLFTTFGYFLEDEENRRVLTGVASMLPGGGIFVIDYLNDQVARKELVPEEAGDYEKLHYHIRRKIKNGMIFKQITFNGDELKGSVQYEERVKLYNYKWFEQELTQRGFNIKKCYGDYTGSKFDEKTSRRLLLIAEKQV